MKTQKPKTDQELKNLVDKSLASCRGECFDHDHCQACISRIQAERELHRREVARENEPLD